MEEDSERGDIVRISTIVDLGEFEEDALGKIPTIPLGPKAVNWRWTLSCQKKLKMTLLCGVRWREETVRNRILNQQNWLFGSAHLYPQPWQSNFDLVLLEMYKEPIWIRLYNLPMEYWGEASMECIGRSLGTLLEVDEDIIENDSYLYARIKIVAIKKVPSAIFLKSGERQWKQQVEVELPVPCREKGESKDHGAGFCPGNSKLAKKWVQIIGKQKVVMATVSLEKVILHKSKTPRVSKSDGNSREFPRTGKNVE
ncbi:hypothetical protein SUGI_1059090 [Cryptomeria japonica]|nr:hypothetical protein SUGI_1059090 [Cryptomeria japonica]